MNQEENSVLDLLRQAVKAASGAGRGPQDGQSGVSPLGYVGVESKAVSEQLLPQASSPSLAGLAGGLTSLVSGSSDKPAWTQWVSSVNPIAGLIAGMFTGREDSAEAASPVCTYLRPESLSLEEGFGGSSDPSIRAVERGEGGQFRPASGSSSATQVVVQVQAMDSQSFLDHTPEIAEAVKRALLESNGLRDVLGEY